jgi:hypothetical protein
MGALDTSRTPPEVTRIESALAAKQAGDAADLNNLILALMPAKDPLETVSVLIGLTHFTAALDDLNSSECRAYELRRLIQCAINMDFSTCLERGATSVNGESRSSDPGEDVAQEPLSAVPLEVVDAYRNFLFNTASADSGFVEDLFSAFARSHFRLPFPAFATLVSRVHDVIPTILNTYPSAEAALIRVLAEKYPHPVRPETEHQNYIRAVLKIASSATTRTLASSLVLIVVEKLAVLDASVPEIVGSCVSDEGALSPVSVTSQDSNLRVQNMQHVDFDAAGILDELNENSEDQCDNFLLDPSALKMDMVASEFLQFSKEWLSPDVNEKERFHRLEVLAHAFERFVVPAQSAHSPFLLLHAASVSGSHHLRAIAEQFRVSFFDPRVSRRVRISYLYLSSGLITHASASSTADVLEWMSKVIIWLHDYIDRHDTRNAAIDTRTNDLFYAGIFAVLSTVCNRPSIFDPYADGDREAADRLRLRRVMSCGMNPLLVMPASLVTRFCDILILRCGMDLSDILRANRKRAIPSRTRFGAFNRFTGAIPLTTCSLPRISKHLRDLLRDDVSKARRTHDGGKRRRLSGGGMARIVVHTDGREEAPANTVAAVGKKRRYSCLEQEAT